MSLHWSEQQYEDYMKRMGKNGNLQPAEIKQAKPAKFHNVKTTIDNIEFDSAVEAERYCDLKLLQLGKVISGLQLQPEFILQEAYVDSNGKKVREMKYIADFRYVENGVVVIEDVKSVVTEKDKTFRLKAKLFQKRYPDIEFRVVMKDGDAFAVKKKK